MPYYRKCSQCGFVESVAWRGSRFHVDWEIADFDEFQAAHPEIASRFRGVGEHYLIIDGEWVYWRQSGQTKHLIHRTPLAVYKANDNHCRGRGTYLESKRRRAANANMKLDQLEVA